MHAFLWLFKAPEVWMNTKHTLLKNVKKLFETWFYAISIDFWVWYKWTKWLPKYVTDYCVYKRLTMDLMDGIISLCVNGPKIKETEEVANISEFSECCSRYTKNGKTYNWNNDSGKYSDSFSTTSDSGYSNTTLFEAVCNLLAYAWSATCNAKTSPVCLNPTSPTDNLR